MGVLRTFLAIAVVVYHSYTIFGLRLCGGQLAVEAFFMISGFYMALVLNEKYVGAGYYKKFIVSRLLRIFPVYWIVLVLALLLSVVGYYSWGNAYYLTRYINHYDCFSPLTIMFFVIENSIIIGQDMLYFLRIDAWCKPQFEYHALLFKHSANQYLFVPQAWSISLELLFYAIAPFIVTKKIRWQLIIIILLFGLKWIYAFHFNLSIDPWTYRFFPFELGFFILGSLAYQVYTIIKNTTATNNIGKVLLLICLLAIVFVAQSPLHKNITNTLFYAIIFCSIPFIFNTFKNNAIDRYIGELSFSIYISHLLIVSILHPIFFKQVLPMAYYGMATLFFSLGLALILHHWVVKPLDKWRIQRIAI